MKLQLNNSGAWKHLLDFDADKAESVKRFADRLMFCGDLSTRTTLRILVDDEKVVAYWMALEGWRSK